ncbi:aminotransferase class V-fold PLP-dependent enzyme [Patescibacteria group bacterium]|nr:aminotransferase class V-fold PLP-dependent enzyme [Patescibacteria group bacterium]
MKKEIYLDHASTTPIDPLVLKAMLPYLKNSYGNAGAIYKIGREAKNVLDVARKSVANAFAAHENEIIFTGGGSESVNLALLGYARANAIKGKSKGHIITTNVEHNAVLNTCAQLQKEGYTITYLSVDSEGLITPEQVKKAVSDNTILVSVIYANNEIGTIEPIGAIGKAIEKINVGRTNKIAFHTDACQAAGHLNLHANDLKADLISINASKLYGPKGVGALYVRTGTRLQPLVFGGMQEMGKRAGTENIAGIVGLKVALELSLRHKLVETKRLTKMRDYFIEQIIKTISNAKLNGHPSKRLPNNVNVSFSGIEGESAVLYLDAVGIACSTGSACNSATLEPSHVILALGANQSYANGALRFTLGRHTTMEDLKYTLSQLKKVVAKLRKISAIK